MRRDWTSRRGTSLDVVFLTGEQGVKRFRIKRFERIPVRSKCPILESNMERPVESCAGGIQEGACDDLRTTLEYLNMGYVCHDELTTTGLFLGTSAGRAGPPFDSLSAHRFDT